MFRIITVVSLLGMTTEAARLHTTSLSRLRDNQPQEEDSTPKQVLKTSSTAVKKNTGEIMVKPSTTPT